MSPEVASAAATMSPFWFLAMVIFGGSLIFFPELVG